MLFIKNNKFVFVGMYRFGIDGKTEYQTYKFIGFITYCYQTEN